MRLIGTAQLCYDRDGIFFTYRGKDMSICTWPADVLAGVLSHSDCKSVMAACSTSKECTLKCAEVFNWPEFPKERSKAAFNCVIHDIFEILREDAHETFPPGWEWMALDEIAFEEFLREHAEARNLDENDVAHISFDTTGSGYFHIINGDEHTIPTFETLFGEHPRNWVAHNEVEFSDFPDCETFATRFAAARNLKTNRFAQSDGYVKIIFCREKINLAFLRSNVDLQTSAVLRYGVHEHSIITMNAGSVQYHDYFADSEDASIRWVASGPQHIIVVGLGDELSVSVQVRHARLRNFITLVFSRYGCSILSDDASDDNPLGWTVFQLPELELKKLPRTRSSRKRYQRRQFLNLLPFLVCDVASPEFDRYVDDVSEFRAEAFSDAIATVRYEEGPQ